MSSIFNISRELMAVVSAIESNDGALTPELEEALTINQDALKSKVSDYVHVITELEGNVATIKEEINRLGALMQSKENTIKRLKETIATAVEHFGDVNKNGNRFIDFGLGKCSIRKSEVVNIDEDRVKHGINAILTYYHGLSIHNQFDVTPPNWNDIEEFYMNFLNSEEIPLSSDDIQNLKANINFDFDFKDLCSTDKGKNLIRALVEYSSAIKAKPAISKTDIKNNLHDTGEIPTYAEVSENKTLIIR